MPNPICPTGTTYVQGVQGRTAVNVKGMCIDTEPVSNKSYNEFLVRKNRKLSSYRRFTRPSAPVEDVSYNDARKYCQSRGMRLLARNEWKWAFLKSGNSLFIGIKGERGWTRREFVKVHSVFGDWIKGRSSGQEIEFTHGGGPSLIGRAPTFRCAIEPKAYWTMQINRLVDGLQLLLREILGWIRNE